MYCSVNTTTLLAEGGGLGLVGNSLGTMSRVDAQRLCWHTAFDLAPSTCRAAMPEAHRPHGSYRAP